ncbi:nuclear transport factor 2 family protein [Actinomadura syzygii]|uniref:Uncharacterized protein n=1 Tax=Actinomadura syzygii TaxID=1427538 RepID=A0A5D0ULK5_9ACTN|nr:nuclear transport factor 2 family protein [Actinomadura syzygii]TYC18512.1 hypothetical protein FXF65_01770 [Actinomadura syzygii]
MTSPSPVPGSLAEMLDERRHLLDIAVWMFGPDAADRVVQQTYRRWYALDDAERARITVPRAWLTRVAGGICLDLLASGTGEPLVPEGPVPRPRPEDGTRDWMSRFPRQDPSDPALLARHDHVARRFAAACRGGDAAALRALLAADAMVVSDGGGKVRAPVHPTHGADAVARFVTNLLACQPRTGQPDPGESGTDVTVESVNGRAGLVLRRAGQAIAVVGVSVADARVTAVWIVLNPDKLRRWHRQ